jgi:hypothetical protein
MARSGIVPRRRDAGFEFALGMPDGNQSSADPRESEGLTGLGARKLGSQTSGSLINAPVLANYCQNRSFFTP